MKRQGASSERKRARIPSGKAGAANGFLMEVCVDSVESAVNAERGGAGRIELCSGLLEGGTTPSMGVLQVVKQYVQIPVFVMIRPRGGDFLYSDREVEVMKADIRLAKLYGADGLVFGALTEDGHIDKELCMSLVAICRPLPVTFHRVWPHFWHVKVPVFLATLLVRESSFARGQTHITVVTCGTAATALILNLLCHKGTSTSCFFLIVIMELTVINLEIHNFWKIQSLSYEKLLKVEGGDIGI
uniref:Copper homeostasis protein cutC homolog n=2 Tax=Sus scrofa TaxID=9823 RepID=A0A8D1ZXE9_PIG